MLRLWSPSRRILASSPHIAFRSFASSSKLRSDMVRLLAGNASDFKDGQMKEVPLDPKDPKSPKVLVSKVAGKLYATSSKCTHFGAPLAKGVLTKTCDVICPWHGARFNVCTGDIEDAPGIGNLYTFSVTEQDGKVFIEGEESKIKAFSRAPSGKCTAREDGGVVVVGGGSGGHHFLEEIRNAGYKGKVTLVAREAYLPLDRTKLSKALITDPSKIALRDEAFFNDNDIDVLTNTSVSAIDLNDSIVSLSSGGAIPFSHLILATGSLAKTLPLPGTDLKGIYTLRDIEDVKKISEAIGSGEGEKKKLVVVGSSFIGMEVAMAASKRAHIDVVGMEKAPFQAILGTEIGNGIRKFHEGNGTKFHMEAQLEKFVPSESDPSHVGGVVLKSGETLPADVVVLGVGAKPDTSLLSEAGTTLEKDGSVAVDERLKVKGAPKGKGEVYAIGDIATYPDGIEGGKPVRVEHWNVAGNHGRHVARLIGQGASAVEPAYSRPAIFWSAQGQQLRYVGTGAASSWSAVHVDGDADRLKFVAYYFDEKTGKVVAVASMQNDPVVAHARELFAQGKFPGIKEIKDGVNPLSIPVHQ